MPRVCNCATCRMARLMAEADDDDVTDLRRAAMVSYYMERFGMMFPEAVAMLDQESKLQWKGAIEAMVSRHGLDRDDAVSHVLTHVINPSELIQ
jgi:hypothetical protein